MRLRPMPRETAREMERVRPRLAGDGEHFAGYGALALPFGSGHLLAFRRFAVSSIGPPYSAVWHRAPDGRWTFYVDVEPTRCCPRYFGAQIQRVVVTEIRLAWTGARELGISLPAARVDLSMRLGSSPATRLLNAALRPLSERARSSPRALALMSALAGPALDAGPLRLTGVAPNGQVFRLIPRQLWRIVAGAAIVGGQELGPLGRLAVQARLGDLLFPSAPLFAFGYTRFEGRVAGGSFAAPAWPASGGAGRVAR